MVGQETEFKFKCKSSPCCSCGNQIDYLSEKKESAQIPIEQHRDYGEARKGLETISGTISGLVATKVCTAKSVANEMLCLKAT